MVRFKYDSFTFDITICFSIFKNNNMSRNIMNIIPYNKEYEFYFVEEDVKIDHPVSNYFLKSNDLSINLLISFKWILWAYKFFNSISKEINNDLYYQELDDIFDNCIQKKIVNTTEVDHILLIDDKIISNEDDFNTLINIFYNNTTIFNENTKIHMKLKLNWREYFIISEQLCCPTFIKWEKIIIHP